MMRVSLLAVLSGALFMAPLAPSTPVFRVATEIVGGSFVHEVQAGETLTSLAARYGVDVAVLAGRNGRAPGATLVAGGGDRLTIDNRHIVWPVESAFGTVLVINVPQRMLFRVVDGRVDAAFPVAVGRATWQTPRGPFTVIEKEVDPTWDVPLSIQAEMEVHPDPYKQGPDPLRHLQTLADDGGISGEIDWERVRDVVRRREGVAVEVTREGATPISGG